MLKKIIVLVNVLLLLFVYCVPTLGAEVQNSQSASVTENGKVQINGTTKEIKNNRVSIAIVRPDNNIMSAVSDEKAKENEKLDSIAICVDQTKVKQNGVFEYQYQLPLEAESGLYTVNISVYGENAVRSATFRYLNLILQERSLEIWKTGNISARQFLDAHIYNIDTDVALAYSSYSDSNKNYIASNLSADKPTDIQGIIQSISASKLKITMLDNMKKLERAVNKKYLEDNAQALGLDVEYIKKYNQMSSSQKESVIISFNERIVNCTTPDGIPGAYENAIDEILNKPSVPEGGGGKKTGIGGGTVITANNVQITNEPMKVEDSKKRFSDIDNAKWAEQAINKLAEADIINGINENEFCPNNLIKREEFVKILVSAFELDAEEKPMTFEDIKETDWFNKYITVAVSCGIVNGTSENTFGIGENITRQDMAELIYRAAEFNKLAFNTVDMDAEFADMNLVNDYAVAAVRKMAKAKIISGKGDGLFDPLGYATRAETAQIFYNILYR